MTTCLTFSGSGKVQRTAKTEEGTTFLIRLPMVDPDEAAMEAEVAEEITA